ncbi:MAG: alpha/beta hydrolase [Deltaproteobacteria bacterium]|nr:alpha/beta hydrolase [Deltaproteobacteria bacterium]
MEPRSIRLPGTHGLHLHALEWSREGTLLLFLHGFSNDAHVWDWVAPVLAPHYRVVALDQRGHGDSDRDPEGRWDHETMARDANAAIESLGASRAVIVGHSLGGRVAMRFAGLFPEKLAGLVIVDSAPDLDARGTTRISLDVKQQDWSFASVADYERVLQRQYAATRPEILAKLAVHWTRPRGDGRFELKLDPAFTKARANVSAEELAAWSEQEAKHLWAALAKLPCPALVVRGAASDVMSAEVADKMVDDVIPNAVLETIARAGHSVMLDNPEAFEKALTGFVLGD